MYVEFDHPEEFVTQCQALALAADEHLLICLAGADEAHLDRIITLLNGAGLRFFGGVFPALVEGGNVRDRGAVAKPVRLLADPMVAQIDGAEVDEDLPFPQITAAAPRPTCLILADFSCVAVTALLEILFNKHGSDVNYFGAGAGNGARVPSPVLFTNAGRFTGAGLIAYIATAAEVRLRHGWSRNSEPVIATRTRGNVLIELNWEPAMKVYRDLVGDQVAESLRRQEDVPEAKRYPFGIAREDLEDVVRDPIAATDADELVVLSGIPEHSVIHILKADNDRLISSAAALAHDFDIDADATSCLIFDCFSRARLLGDDFANELTAFVDTLAEKRPACRIEGALALGEISSDGNRFPDFHNKTIAAGIFHDRG